MNTTKVQKNINLDDPYSAPSLQKFDENGNLVFKRELLKTTRGNASVFHKFFIEEIREYADGNLMRVKKNKVNVKYKKGSKFKMTSSYTNIDGIYLSSEIDEYAGTYEEWYEYDDNNILRFRANSSGHSEYYDHNGIILYKLFKDIYFAIYVYGRLAYRKYSNWFRRNIEEWFDEDGRILHRKDESGVDIWYNYDINSDLPCEIKCDSIESHFGKDGRLLFYISASNTEHKFTYHENGTIEKHLIKYNKPNHILPSDDDMCDDDENEENEFISDYDFDENGKYDHVEVYDEEGRLRYEKRNTYEKSYYENGILSNFKDRRYKIIYNERGNIVYHKDRKDEYWCEYYKNGNIMKKIHDNEISVFDRNGSLKYTKTKDNSIQWPVVTSNDKTFEQFTIIDYRDFRTHLKTIDVSEFDDNIK